MFVLIPGSISRVRFGPAGTDPAEIFNPAVTNIIPFYPRLVYLLFLLRGGNGGGGVMKKEKKGKF